MCNDGFEKYSSSVAITNNLTNETIIIHIYYWVYRPTVQSKVTHFSAHLGKLRTRKVGKLEISRNCNFSSKSN